MIEIEKVEVYGWPAAIRGMRNAKNSWDKSDSIGLPVYETSPAVEYTNNIDFLPTEVPIQIGKNDMKLMQTLVNGGTDHGKFMRFITVTFDITAPLYWWKEFDTYKVGTVANSCSTMHKIHAKEFTRDDFSWEHLYGDYAKLLDGTIDVLNVARKFFIETKEKDYWWQMIQLLPSSYNQKRTISLNYAVLRNIYFARRGHKLDEWHTFCDWIESLPYGKELICYRREKNEET